MSSPTVPKYVAKAGIASGPDGKMLGAVLLAFVQNINAEELEPFLTQFHMSKIEPHEWYSEQLILDFENAILTSRFNSSENLVAIGVKGIDTTPFPPDIKTFEDAIESMNGMSKYVTQNMPDEAKMYIAVHSADGPTITANLPYPKDILYGYIWALARRYKPAGRRFSVKFVENPDPENFPGQAYKVTWE